MAGGAYKGLTIRIGADTTKFASALRGIESVAFKTQKQLNNLTKAAKLDPGNKQVQNLQLGALSNQATNVAREITILKKGIDELSGQKVLDEHGKEEVKTIKELAEETENVTLRAQETKSAYNDVNKELEILYHQISKENPKLKLADIRQITNEGKFNQSVLDQLVQENKITQEQADRVMALKERWVAANAAMSNYARAADLGNLNAKLAQQGVNLRNIITTMRSMDKQQKLSSTSSVDQSLTAVNGRIALLTAASATATARLNELNQAAKIDPGNFDIAGQRAEALVQHIEVLKEMLQSYQEKVAAIESSDVAKASDGFKNVAISVEEARKNLDEAHDVVTEITLKLTELHEEARTASDDLDDVGDSGKDMKDAADNAEKLAESIENVGKQSRSIKEIEKDISEYEGMLAEAQKKQDYWDKAFDTAKAQSELQAYKNKIIEIQQAIRQAQESFGGWKAQSNLVDSGVFKGIDQQLKLISSGLETAKGRFSALNQAAQIRPHSLSVAVSQLQAFRDATEAARQKADALKQKLDAYKATGIDKLSRNVTDVSANFEKAQANVDRLQRELAECKTSTTEEVAEAGRLAEELARAKEAAKTAAAISEYRNLEAELHKVQAESQAMKNSMKADLGEVGAAAVQAAQQIGQLMQQAWSSVSTASNEVDSAYRDLRKTFNAEEKDYQTLYDAAMKYSQSHVTSADTMLEMEATAAQLGVGLEGGAEAIQKFADAAANLDVATDIDADTIALQMGQIMNVMNDVNTDNIDKFGDALVRLGNNMPTQESNIMQITQRLAAVGDVAGFTTPELMGWAAAIASTGQKSEAAATGVATTITTIQKAVSAGGDDLAKFAKVAGVSADEFASKWRSNPTEALKEFLSGLKNLGDSEFAELENLGISGVRQTQTLTALAQTVGRVGDSIRMAKDAFNGVDDEFGKAGDAAREAERKSEGFSGSLAKMQNSAKVLAASLGPAIVPILDDIAGKLQWLTGVVDSMSDKTKTKILKAATAFMAFSAAYPVISALGSSLGKFASGALSFAIKMFAKLQTAITGFKLGGGIVELASSSGKLAAVGSVLGKIATFALSAQGALAILAAVIAGKLISSLVKSAAHAKKFGDVMEGIHNISEGLHGEMLLGSEYTGKYGRSWQEAKIDLNDFLESMQAHADAVKQTREETKTSIGMLSEYQKIIDEAASAEEKSAVNKGKLKWALDGLADATGQVFEVEDVLNGKYEDQEGVVRNTKQAIDELIESKKRELQLAAMEDIYTETFKSYKEAEIAYNDAREARRKYVAEFKEENQGRMKRDEWTGQLREYTDAELTYLAHAQDEYRDLDQAVDDTRESYRKLGKEVDNVSGSMKGLYDRNDYENEKRFGDREGIILTTEAIRDAIIENGKWGSSLEEIQPKVKELSKKLMDSKVGVEEFYELANNHPDVFAGMIEQANGDMDQLVAMIVQWNQMKLDEKYADFIWDGTGYERADGARIEWNGNEWKMVETKVDVDTTEVDEAEEKIKDSDGNNVTTVYDTEGAEEVMETNEAIENTEDKNISVNYDTQGEEEVKSVTDGIMQTDNKTVTITFQPVNQEAVQGVIDSLATVPANTESMITVTTQGVLKATERVTSLNSAAANMANTSATYTANGNATTKTPSNNISSLNSAAGSMADRSATYTAYGNAANGSAASNVWNLVSAINNLSNKTVTVTTNYVNNGSPGHSATGAYIPYNKIPKHASGIFTRPTLTNIGWVGEDGAELYSGNSLVPLTNRKYSMPYINDISDAVAKKLGGLGTVNNFYINDAVVNGDAEIEAAFLALFDTLARKGALNVG